MSGGYTDFAKFYDALMCDVEYARRADCYISLIKRLGGSPGLVLDLACGTGSFSVELAKRGMEVIGVDASSDMLMAAQEKARETKQSILFLCQRMEELDLYGTVDTVFCTLDSLNHLLTEEALSAAFEKVSLFLEPDGYFLFDTNTLYKHEHVLAGNTFVRETDDVFCVWQNRPLKGHVVEITLDFFCKGSTPIYTRATEVFSERAYTTGTIRTLLHKAGLELIGRFDEWGGEFSGEEQERIVYVAKSRKIKDETNGKG